MLVLSKNVIKEKVNKNIKRIILLIIMIIMPIFTFTFQVAKNKKIVSTMSVPVTNKVIVIDAGHRRRRWWSTK